MESFSEEMLFRGFFFTVISRMFGVEFAIISSALIQTFSKPPAISILGFTRTFSFGCLYAMLYSVCGENLAVPILLHIVFQTSSKTFTWVDECNKVKAETLVSQVNWIMNETSVQPAIGRGYLKKVEYLDYLTT